MTDVWTCCQCRAPNLEANAPTKCPVCNHTRCSSCKVGQSPLPGGHPYLELWSRSRAPREDVQALPRGSALEPYSLQPPGNALDASRGPVPHLSLQQESHAFRTGAKYGTAWDVPAYPPPRYTMHLGDFCSFSPTIQTFPKPSTRGYWECCATADRHLNNPALTPDKCVMCPHMKCGNCTVLES